MTDDNICIVEYNPNWPLLFDQEATMLSSLLHNSKNIVAIKHFGSTAVPGLAAKPIIDIMMLVESLEDAKGFIPLLKTVGYIDWPDDPNKDRFWLVKGMPPFGTGRTHHLHIVEEGNTDYQHRLKFCEYLRQHPEEARTYETLKKELANRFPEDREAYTAAKVKYLQSVQAKIF